MYKTGPDSSTFLLHKNLHMGDTTWQQPHAQLSATNVEEAQIHIPRILATVVCAPRYNTWNENLHLNILMLITYYWVGMSES